MKAELSKLAKHTGIYGVGIILSKAVGFFMIPVYTHFLSPADYGVLELLDLITFFVGIFAAAGIYSAVFRFYAAYSDTNDKREVISSALLFVSISSLIFSAFVIHSSSWLAMLVLGNPSQAGFVRIVALTLFFSNLSEVPMAYFRAEGKSVLFVSLSLFRTILGVSQLTLFLAVLKRGIEGALWANLITNGLFGIGVFVGVLYRTHRRPSRAKLEEMLRYGAPLIIQSLGSFILVFSDRFFLRKYASLTEVGIYSLGYKLAGVVAVLVNGPFSLAWSWHQFELAQHKDADRLFPRVQIYQFFVSMLIGLAISVLSRDYLHILTPSSYWYAAWVVPLIVLCYIAENMRQVILSQMLIKKLTSHIAMITFAGALTALALNFLLIPRYHIIGAAVATLVAYGVALVLSFVASQRISPIAYDYRRNTLILVWGVACCAVSFVISLPPALSILLNLGLLIVFLILCFFSLDPEERKALLQVRNQIADKLGWGNNKVVPNPGGGS